MAAPLPAEAHHLSDTMDVIAHRGDIEHHPDNSWASIDSAVQKGADWIEIDVHLNLESNFVVLAHDNECYYTIGGSTYKVYIDTSSWAEVLWCGLPLLDDVLEQYKGIYHNFMVEIKETSWTYFQIAPAVRSIIHTHGMQHDAWVTAFEFDMLRQIRDSGSPIKLMANKCVTWWWIACPWGNPKVSTFLASAASEGFQGVNLNLYDADSNSVSLAESYNLRHSAWTLQPQSQDATDEALNKGLHMFMTDHLDYSLNKLAMRGHQTGGSPDQDCETDETAIIECP
jgi:glycerophosphoryl diester phosphodiesterase